MLKNFFLNFNHIEKYERIYFFWKRSLFIYKTIFFKFVNNILRLLREINVFEILNMVVFFFYYFIPFEGILNFLRISLLTGNVRAIQP